MINKIDRVGYLWFSLWRPSPFLVLLLKASACGFRIELGRRCDECVWSNVCTVLGGVVHSLAGKFVENIIIEVPPVSEAAGFAWRTTYFPTACNYVLWERYPSFVPRGVRLSLRLCLRGLPSPRSTSPLPQKSHSASCRCGRSR